MLELTDHEKHLLEGGAGAGAAIAARVVVAAADFLGARRLLPIVSAHIDGCLHHGDGGVEFAEALRNGGARVSVPTTLNVGALDLLHPGVVRADPHKTDMARRQMEAYVAMGAEPTFTCAPYQVGHLPGVGDQVAWGESNAIAFVNSVCGARTERYGDFLDACCAITGRAPAVGLHLDEPRRATVVVDVTGVPDALKQSDVFYPVFGTWLGLEVGGDIGVIDGLPADTTRDRLKALGAAAASSGAVALFHVAGVTPEAPSVEAALGGTEPTRRVVLTSDRLRPALERLSTADVTDSVDAIAVGSPHFSRDEIRSLHALLAGRRIRLPFYVCTARGTLEELAPSGIPEALREAGVEIVADTCVVVTPILPTAGGVLMTNSGKFAHYGPANTGYEVLYGSLADCVETAVAGRTVRAEGTWTW